MAVRNFDQLNNLRGYAETWFSTTDMPQAKKKKRIDLCMEFTELMILLFYMITEQELQPDEYERFLSERLKIIASNYIGTENLAYVNDWCKKQAKKIVNTTNKMYEAELDDIAETEAEKIERNIQSTAENAENKTEQEESKEEEKALHFEEFNVDIPKDEYPTSDFRACLIAIECVTAVANYDDYFQAYKEGKHRKTWNCGFYKNSRNTHQEAHGQETSIDNLFSVGDSTLSFPGDITHDPDMKEIYGCKCWCEYF